MSRWRIISVVTLASLITACSGQLASKSEELQAQGYKKLNPYAYIREKTNGGGFSTISEGKFGSFAIKLYLKRELISTQNELAKLNNQGKSESVLNSLERRKRSIKSSLSSLESAASR
jgi:hypothetical protein